MILVTGSDGFIGRNLSKFLDNKIYGLDRKLGNVYEQLAQVPWENIEKIIHLGAISYTTETDVNLICYYNTQFSISLFKEAIKHNIPVQYASSASVYGNGKGPINLYGASKLTVDLWVQDNISKFKQIHGYRFYNVYGKEEDHKIGQASPISTFIKQAKETGQIKLFETHDGCRDFIWVGDVCRIMFDELRPSGIYDCGTSKPEYFSRIAQLVADKYGAEIITIPTPDHIKKIYQERTCASETDGLCISVEDYLSSTD